MTSIQCYILITEHSDEEAIESYERIQFIVNHIPASDQLFIIGDFKYKLGNCHINYSCATAQHILFHAYAHGELLIYFTLGLPLMGKLKIK